MSRTLKAGGTVGLAKDKHSGGPFPPESGPQAEAWQSQEIAVCSWARDSCSLGLSFPTRELKLCPRAPRPWKYALLVGTCRGRRVENSRFCQPLGPLRAPPVVLHFARWFWFSSRELAKAECCLFCPPSSQVLCFHLHRCLRAQGRGERGWRGQGTHKGILRLSGQSLDGCCVQAADSLSQ